MEKGKTLAAKTKEFNLTDFNRGHPRKDLKVGDRVTMYRIPYREKSPIYDGTVLKIHRFGLFTALCDVKKDGTENVYLESVYLGKIWTGWQKP